MIGLFKAKLNTLVFSPEGTPMIMLDVDKDSRTAIKQIVDELDKDIQYTFEVSRSSKRKTLDQNAYLWVLCDRIAMRIHSTKEEVYKGVIKDVGTNDILCVQNKAVDRFCDNWSKKGLGWFCERTDSKIKDCTNVICYYGTSCYDRDEMSRVIEEIVNEAKSLGISTEVKGYEGY